MMPLNESGMFGVGVLGKLIVVIIGEIDTHSAQSYPMTWQAGGLSE